MTKVLFILRTCTKFGFISTVPIFMSFSYKSFTKHPQVKTEEKLKLFWGWGGGRLGCDPGDKALKKKAQVSLIMEYFGYWL